MQLWAVGVIVCLNNGIGGKEVVGMSRRGISGLWGIALLIVVAVCLLCIVESAFADSIGSVIGWGYNSKGQATPPDGNDFLAIAAGGAHSLAIREPCQYLLVGDLNDDCRIDLADLAKMAANWLIDCRLNPTDPECIPK